MVSYLKTRDGYIYALAEWFIVDHEGYNSANGEYVFVKDLWIHDKQRFKDAIKYIIFDINDRCRLAKYVYWNRTKYNKRRTPNLSRSRLARMGVEYGRA